MTRILSTLDGWFLAAIAAYVAVVGFARLVYWMAGQDDVPRRERMPFDPVEVPR